MNTSKRVENPKHGLFCGNQSSYNDVGYVDYESYKNECSKYESIVVYPPKEDVINNYSYDWIWTGIERHGPSIGKFTKLKTNEKRKGLLKLNTLYNKLKR